MMNQKVRWIEISAVIVTAIFKFLLVNWLNQRFIFISLTIIFWVAYILLRIGKDKDILTRWGLTTKNLKPSFTSVSLFALMSLSFLFIYASIKGPLNLNWHLIPILLIYPVWGIMQQFLVMSLIAKNLKEMALFKDWLIILITSFLFSVVHLPSPVLTIGTFLLALYYTVIFLKWGNIWPLGLYHGWIGGLFYFLILKRDPWAEVFNFLY